LDSVGVFFFKQASTSASGQLPVAVNSPECVCFIHLHLSASLSIQYIL